MTPKNLWVFQGDHVFVVLNRFPYNPGHLLVLPQRHVANLEDLTPGELSELFQTVTLSIKVLKKVYRPKGFNVGLNLGQAAGAGIPQHLHVHVVPRWGGDLNFFPLLGSHKVIIETLEQSWARIHEGFVRLGSKRARRSSKGV